MLTKLSNEELIAEINKLNDYQKYKVYEALQVAYYAEDLQELLDGYEGEDVETTFFVKENFNVKQYAKKFFNEGFDESNPVQERLEMWFEEWVARMLKYPSGDGN